MVDDAVRRLILQNVDAGTIRKQAATAGLRSLLLDGVRNVLEGRTTPEEVLRVAKDEEVVVA